ncbi:MULTISPECIES: HesB/IscA family protein [Heliobacterium]|nr:MULTISPECIES: iron-sulfur cluster biosynthesis family protein [Heliobacterium]
MTEKAQEMLKGLLTENNARYIRIYALSREHSSYELGLEWEVKRDDVVFESGGISFVADSVSKEYLSGVRIIYDDSDDEPGFLVTSTCNSSCGASGCDGVCPSGF